MRLPFTHGIVRGQRDIDGNPGFLLFNSARTLVDLVVAPSPTILAISHRDVSYIVEEAHQIPGAWNVSQPGNKWLYWDINFSNAIVTHGVTLLPPLFTALAPTSPAIDQHWFDTQHRMTFVWNGTAWVEKLRLFAAHVTSYNTIEYFPMNASQAGITGLFDAGNIILDQHGAPLRTRIPTDPPHWNARFITSASWLNVSNLSSSVTRLEQQIFIAEAAENIGAYSVVAKTPDGRVKLARSTDWTTRICGVVQEARYESDSCVVSTTGVIKNGEWEWPPAMFGRPVFAGPSGQIVTKPPQTGVLQQLGFVEDSTTIFIDTKAPVILDDLGIQPVADTIYPPDAAFTVTVDTTTIPVTATFTSLADDATTFEWDFQNDGHWDTTSRRVTHVYDSPGIFSVRHRVSNSAGTSEVIRPNVVVANPSTPILPYKDNLRVSLTGGSNITSKQNCTLAFTTTNSGRHKVEHVQRTMFIRADSGADLQLIGYPNATMKKFGAGSAASPTIYMFEYPMIESAADSVISEHVAFRINDANTTQLIVSIRAHGLNSDNSPADNEETINLKVVHNGQH